MLRIAPAQVRDLALGLVELHGPTQGCQSQDLQNSVGPDDIIYFLFLIFCYACHLCSYWLVAGLVQEWKQAMSCWITVSSAKAEVLLLKVIISDMSLILHYLPESQTQTWGGTDRWAQGALTEEPWNQDSSGNWTQCSLLLKTPSLFSLLYCWLSFPCSLGCSLVLPDLNNPEHPPCSGIWGILVCNYLMGYSNSNIPGRSGLRKQCWDFTGSKEDKTCSLELCQVRSINFLCVGCQKIFLLFGARSKEKIPEKSWFHIQNHARIVMTSRPCKEHLN